MTIAFMEQESASEYLRELRARLRLSQKEFAAKLGVDRERYKNWEYGTPPPPAVVREAKRLDYGANEPRSVGAIPTAPIPVVGGVEGGPGNGDHPDDDQIMVPAHMARPDVTGWVASGDSMMPWIQPGDVVVARESRTPRVNSTFLVRRPDHTVSVKQLVHDGKRWTYHSVNPSYPDQEADGELIGYVVGIYRVVGSHEFLEFNATGLAPG